MSAKLVVEHGTERASALRGGWQCFALESADLGYFTDEANRRHVIAATDGLSYRVFGNVQFRFASGLLGQVAEGRPPVKLDRVPADLDQGFVMQAGAGPCQGFLGVPVTHKGSHPLHTTNASLGRWIM